MRDSLLTELGLAPYAPLTVQNQYVFKKQGPLQWWVLSKKVTFFAALVKLHFLAAKWKGIPEDTVNSIFFVEQKKNIKWRRRRKKIRLRCKNAAFYTRVTQQNIFCGAKNENGAAGKKFKLQPRTPTALREILAKKINTRMISTYGKTKINSRMENHTSHMWKVIPEITGVGSPKINRAKNMMNFSPDLKPKHNLFLVDAL